MSKKIPPQDFYFNFIYGRKNLAKYYGIHIRTLEAWHRKNPIPWEKTGPNQSCGIRIKLSVADHYYTNRNQQPLT